DINVSSARAYFQRSGQPTRSNLSCVNLTTSGNEINFSCSIDMWYFDQAGSWTINVTIKDINNAQGENSSTTFTFNTLTAMVMSPTSLTWPTITPTNTDIGSNNDPITINNTGNAEPLSINITAYNLRGETLITKFIFANNFTVQNSSEGCSGTIMQNATSINVTSARLFRGNNSLNYNNETSGQEQIFFCLKGVPQDATAQSYSTAGSAAWEIKVLLAPLVYTRRKRRNIQKLENDELLKAMDIILEELRKEYSLNKKELVEILIKKLRDRYKVSKKDILSLIRTEEELEIPLSIFSSKVGALESLVKYMKENLRMSYREIANRLKRNERTIWTSYKKANEKQKEAIKISDVKNYIPLSHLIKENLTVLESAILYLKNKEFSFKEIADLLHRDQRNIWTIYSRIKKKYIIQNE
ncbi:MAG: hypothetical protein QW727_04275, partial [Candidatus Pacearchaeota archaeon]